MNTFRTIAATSLIATACVAAALPASGALHAQATLAKGTGSASRFEMVRSTGAEKAGCLPQARGAVTVVPGDANDLMLIRVAGLPPDTDFDFFVTQLPDAPFGVSWYQSDLHTNASGYGAISVRGIFDAETFSLSPGGPAGRLRPGAGPDRPCSGGHQRHAAPDAPVPSGPVVQQPGGRSQGGLPGGGDAVQRGAARRHPGAQHAQLPRHRGPPLAGPPLDSVPARAGAAGTRLAARQPRQATTATGRATDMGRPAVALAQAPATFTSYPRRVQPNGRLTLTVPAQPVGRARARALPSPVNVSLTPPVLRSNTAGKEGQPARKRPWRGRIRREKPAPTQAVPSEGNTRYEEHRA